MSSISLSSQNEEFVSRRIFQHLPFIRDVNVSLFDRHDTERREIENYIHTKFHNRYAANIYNYLPNLLTLSYREKLCAAVGIRPAESGALFLEQYLSHSIEQEIGNQLKTEIKRDNIVEIGNLVSTWRGSSQLLFLCLTHLLFNANREWVVFTATGEVNKLLGKLKFSAIHIADAAVDKIRNDPSQWGNYYEEQPKVMLGYVPEAMEILNNNTLMSSSLSLFSEQLENITTKWNLVNEQ